MHPNANLLTRLAAMHMLVTAGEWWWKFSFSHLVIALGFCSYLNINLSMTSDSLNEGLTTKKAR